MFKRLQFGLKFLSDLAKGAQALVVPLVAQVLFRYLICQDQNILISGEKPRSNCRR